MTVKRAKKGQRTGVNARPHRGDFLDEIVSARADANPAFPRLLAEAEARRKQAREWAAVREARQLSQSAVATLMGTSASVVSKLEHGADVKLSTLQRYFEAIGKTLRVA